MADQEKCSYAYLSTLDYSPAEACKIIGKGLCSQGKYFNMYRWYYCSLNQTPSVYFLVVALFFIFMMYNLNYIRRVYYIQHIQSLRKLLKLPDFITESILVPVSYGVVPIFIRILASTYKLEFYFHTGANSGACFNLITLFTGVCAMKIGLSPPVNMRLYVLNVFFVFLGNLMHLPLGSRKVINYFDSIVYFCLFGMYLLARFWLAKWEQRQQLKVAEGKEGLVDTPSPVQKIESVVVGFKAITEFVLKIEEENRLKKQNQQVATSEIEQKEQPSSPNSLIPKNIKNMRSNTDEELGSSDISVSLSSRRGSSSEELAPEYQKTKSNQEKYSDTLKLFYRKINAIYLRISRKTFGLEILETQIENTRGNDESPIEFMNTNSLCLEDEITKDMPLCQIVDEDQEEQLGKFIDQFDPKFAIDAKKLTFIDKKSIIDYGLTNKQVTSALVIGWEVTEILYKNERNTPFRLKSRLAKIMALCDIPIELFTRLTILPNLTSEDNILPKLRLIFNPLFSSYFIAFVLTHGSDVHSWVFFMIFLANLFTCCWIIYPVVFTGQAPSARFYRLISVNNLVMSMLSFYMICDVIVEIFRSLHILFNFKYAFFTMSLFSMVIWIPAVHGAYKTTDLMRVVPGYNGAVFNTLLVFGFCLAIHEFLRGEVRTQMWPLASNSQSDLGTAFFVLNSLVPLATYLHLRRRGFRFTEGLGLLLTGLYFVVNFAVLTVGFFLDY